MIILLGLFSKKKEVPDELPDIPLEGSESSESKAKPTAQPVESSTQKPAMPAQVQQTPASPSNIPSLEVAPSMKVSNSPQEVAQISDPSLQAAAKEKGTILEEWGQREIKYRPLPTTQHLNPKLVQVPKLEQVEGEDKQDKKEEKLSKEKEQSYFKDLIKNIIEQSENLDKLDSWYKKKFLPEDIVVHMREYWEKQQPQLLLKSVGGELKEKLVEKTERLHELEREWQEIYLELLAKEEEIRKQEKELKEALAEFITLLKESKQRLRAKNR
ncbi:hypothetical protein D6817_01525, partial [Candidatus Pacearchaeota archaeon]